MGVFKYKNKLNDMNTWKSMLLSSASKIVYKYYGLTLTLFSEKNNKIKKVYKEKASYYVDIIVEFRDRISCKNKKCKARWYQHKYDATFASPKMWKRELIRKWYKCGRCKVVYYCSRRCQKYDWNRFHHKT